MSLLNGNLVVVGLREGPPCHQKRTVTATDNIIAEPVQNDPYAHKHMKIIARLLHFIEVVTTELEHSNAELARLSVTDKLTQLYNRLKLDEMLTH